MAYPFKNNLNISYQDAMANDARSKAMGDYDAINVNSEELIDYTPGFQDQYDADMAKVAQNNQRIKELEAIIAQKKLDEINFSKYRNNPLYKAAKFDYVVNGDRSGLDQFLADERAREQMLSAEKIAGMNMNKSKSYADSQDEDKLEMALLNADQAKRNLANDPGNDTLQEMAERTELTYNQIAKRMGRKSYKELQEEKNAESNEASNTPAVPAKSKVDTSKDYMAEIKQATAKGDYKKLTELLAELNDDAHKNETQFNDARTAATSAIAEMDKKIAADRKAAEDKKKLQTEYSTILKGIYGYSEGQDKIKRLNQIAKQLKLEETYELDGDKIVVRNK